MAGEGGKKNDPTVPIVIGIGAILLLLLFGGCGNINLPTIGPNTGSGNPGSSPSYSCDSRRYDCRGHYDDTGRWIPDQNAGRDERHGRGHERTKPRPTDDPDPQGSAER